MEMNLVVVIFVILLFCVILGFVLGVGWGWLKIKKTFFDKPKLNFPKIKHKKFLKEVLKYLPALSGEEKEIVIQQIFGRPIRVLKGVDKDGTSWIELVSYFTIDDDQAFHYDESKKLKEMTG